MTNKKEYIPERPDKPKTSKIIGSVILGIVFSLVLVFTVCAVYTKMVKFPAKETIKEEETGIYCLNTWLKGVQALNLNNSDSYIMKEKDFANGNDIKIGFYTKVLSTVSYTPKVANAKNVYGNDYKDKNWSVVTEESTVHEGEEVTFSYIDYSKISFNEDLLKELYAKYSITYGCVDYENKIVDVFCEYITNLNSEELPTTSEDRVPSIAKLAGDSYYTVLNDEDQYVDKLLFSSDAFYDMLDRFSIASANALGGKLTETKDWKVWSKLSEEDKKLVSEPSKYDEKYIVPHTWCGAYYLENEYEVKDSNGEVIKTGISAEIGDGTFENPAGYDTDVVTSTFIDGKSYPIRISLSEYGVSEDAVNWFESKDIRNRGIDVNSEVQYCYYVFKVTNLSDKKITISDNTALCDTNVNTSARTGVMYGLKDSVTLNPDETGIIESWNKSTELNTKYVIWGNDFNRRCDPVWFRLLAGNIDDPSEDKGVKINNTRDNNTLNRTNTETENTTN